MAKSSQAFQFFLFSLLLLRLSDASQGGIAIYWGQNGNEETLSEACSFGKYAHVKVAFLNQLGNGQTPQMNLAGHYNPAIAGSCAKLSSEVKDCQQAKGIKVLLSISGGIGIYSLFDQFKMPEMLPSTCGTLSWEGKRKEGVHKWGPTVPLPDRFLGTALNTGLFDFVWVLFYNNPPYQYTNGNITILVNLWSTWTRSVPAGRISLVWLAGSGYVLADVLTSEILPAIKKSPKYGGVMFWLRFYDKQSGYIDSMIGSV